ncbi:MAG: hypothetical protein AB1715_13235 [Acidobacteriota bacterium]
MPPALIGKVSALLLTLSGGLSPLAMAAAGGAAEVIPIRILMSASFGVMLLCFVPLFFGTGFKQFLSFDPSRQSVESLIAKA